MKSKLTFRSKLAFALVGLAFLGTAINFGIKKHQKNQALKASKHDAIFQIISTKGGNCTAFAVSDTLAITAGHCVDLTETEIPLIRQQLQQMEAQINMMNPMQAMMVMFKIKELRQLLLEGPSVFIIRNSKGQDTGVRAVGLDAEDRRDIAYLRGNFKDFHKLGVIARSQGIYEGDSYQACGYAAGNVPYVCVNFEAASPHVFGYKGKSQFVPGMSGGPLLNKHGLVVGILSSAIQHPNNLEAFCYVETTLGIF